MVTFTSGMTRTRIAVTEGINIGKTDRFKNEVCTNMTL